MLSERYSGPLRIELTPSRHHRLLVILPHLVTALLVLYLAFLHPGWLMLLLPILYSYRLGLRDYRLHSAWQSASLHEDGRISLAGEGQERSGMLLAPAVFLPGLIIVPAQLGVHRQRCLFFVDALSADDWHRLNLFFRLVLRLPAEQ